MELTKQGWTLDNDTGLMVPTPSAGSGAGYAIHPFQDPNRRQILKNPVKVDDKGVFLQHEEQTGVAFWPLYATGWDDALMRAMAQGYMINAESQTPVPMTMFSTLIAKRQGMAGTWTTVVKGRKSPVGRFLDVLSRANDSQFGPSEFVSQFIGALDTDNRGAMGVQVPIGQFPFDEWERLGMTVEPVEAGRREDLGVLRMDTPTFRANQGIWMLDGLNCFPTGNPEYPFWYRAYSVEQKRWMYTLIHRDFGFQIIQQIGPRNDRYAGYGQSGAWRFSPYMIKQMALQRMDWEHLINQPPRGIVWASGLDTPTQFRDSLRAFHEDREENEVLFYPGVLFGGSRNSDAAIRMIPWTEPPAGYEPKAWIDEVVSNLASAFHMNETHLRLKLGEGALTQSGVAEGLEAETSIAWMRTKIEQVYNHLSPPRVIVSVVWQSDRTKRYAVESFKELMLGVSRVNKPNPNEPGSDAERLVLSRAEIRAWIAEFLGMPLEPSDPEEETHTDRKTSEDIEDIPEESGFGERFNWQQKSMSLALAELKFPRMIKYAQGTAVIDKDGRKGTITGWDGTSEWVWVKFNGRKHESLRQTAVLYPVTQKAEQNGHCTHCEEQKATITAGMHVRTPDGALAEVQSVRNGRAWVNTGEKEATYSVDRLIAAQFEPDEDDEPLPEPDEDDVEEASTPWEDIVVGALALWAILMGTWATLFGWEWDEDLLTWIDPETGEPISQEQLAELRDEFGDNAQDHYTDPEKPSSLVALLLAGAITLAVFEERMRQAILISLTVQYMLAAGGPDRLTDLDIANIQAEALRQWQFLNNFVRDIATGNMSEAEIAWRAGLYLQGVGTIYDQARASAFDPRLRLPAHPKDGSSECLMHDKCFWQIEPLEGFIVAYWIRTWAESCPTCIRREECPPVIFDTETGEHFNRDCYINE
jgi:hypothetical protein